MKTRMFYRPSVVGVFVNENNQVLVALRSDTRTWQFPQGGVEENEEEERALFREMKEEIGCDQFDIIKKTKSKIRYDFPKNFTADIAKEFKGQEQTWFLCKFLSGFGPNIKESSSDEFLDIKWISSKEMVDTIVDWKRPSYIQGLKLLGLY